MPTIGFEPTTYSLRIEQIAFLCVLICLCTLHYDAVFFLILWKSLFCVFICFFVLLYVNDKIMTKKKTYSFQNMLLQFWNAFKGRVKVAFTCSYLIMKKRNLHRSVNASFLRGSLVGIPYPLADSLAKIIIAYLSCSLYGRIILLFACL